MQPELSIKAVRSKLPDNLIDILGKFCISAPPHSLPLLVHGSPLFSVSLFVSAPLSFFCGGGLLEISTIKTNVVTLHHLTSFKQGLKLAVAPQSLIYRRNVIAENVCLCVKHQRGRLDWICIRSLVAGGADLGAQPFPACGISLH